MPYKLTPKGQIAFTRNELGDLTDNQKKALEYLQRYSGAEFPYVESSEIARYYGLAPQAMRGSCYWLMKKGLVEVKEE